MKTPFRPDLSRMLCLGCAVLLGLLAISGSAAPRVFILDAPRLENVRAQVRKGDKTLASAVAELEREARALLNVPIFSVVNKETLPPSGDKHDYMSLAPYFWPNPNTTNGLPYLRRDGERNPEIYKIPNRLHLGEMTDAVETLSLAYYFTGNETYAAKATALIRGWFLDTATRMNPHLEYGQAIKGINTGRGIGIIESRAFTRVVDSIGLLADAKAWTKADQQGMERWFDSYLKWMLESKHGRDEAAAKNNHGTYYDVQVASFAFFIGKKEIAVETLRNAGPKRIAVQVEPDGKQPLELERTRAWSYSVGNLAGLMTLAKLGEHAGVDLWRYESPDGRSIRKAVDYLLPFGLEEKPWPYQQIDGWKADLFYPVLRLAALKYPESRYRDLTAKLPAVSAEKRVNLLFSPLDPVSRLHLPVKSQAD